MSSRSSFNSKRCLNYFIFTAAALIVTFGLMEMQMNDVAGNYIIVTGILVLIVGLLLVIKELKRVNRVSNATPTDPIDPPPVYRDTWRKSYLEDQKNDATTEPPPPSYRDSWSKGTEWQSRRSLRHGQDNTLFVLDPYTLAEDVANLNTRENPLHAPPTSPLTNSNPAYDDGSSNPILTQPRTHSSRPTVPSNTPELERIRSAVSRVSASSPAEHQRMRPQSFSHPTSMLESSHHHAIPSFPPMRMVDDDLAVITASQLVYIYENRVH